jgi:hypothetical protein
MHAVSSLNTVRDDVYRTAATALHHGGQQADGTVPRCGAVEKGRLGVCWRCEHLSSIVVDAVIEILSSEVKHLHTWAGLLDLLDEHWPEAIFPTMVDDQGRDPGVRLLSIVRTLVRVTGEKRTFP